MVCDIFARENKYVFFMLITAVILDIRSRNTAQMKLRVKH